MARRPRRTVQASPHRAAPRRTPLARPDCRPASACPPRARLRARPRLTAVRNSPGFTVALTGYVTDRELTQAIFQFTAAAGSNLQTTTATVTIDTLFAGYFS